MRYQKDSNPQILAKEEVVPNPDAYYLILDKALNIQQCFPAFKGEGEDVIKKGGNITELLKNIFTDNDLNAVVEALSNNEQIQKGPYKTFRGIQCHAKISDMTLGSEQYAVLTLEFDKNDSIFQLKERVKELNGLRRAAGILFHENYEVDEAIERVCKLIPEIYMYPQEAVAKITIDGEKSFTTPSFKETAQIQRAKFKTQSCSGKIEVGYLKELPEVDEGPFSAEERNMLHSLTNMIKTYLERNEFLERLRESKKSYYELFNHVGDAIYVLDENGVFLDVNETAEEMYGYTKSEIIGNTPEMLSAPGKNDMERTLDNIHKALHGEKMSFKWWGMRKNGEVFPKEVKLSSTSYFGKEAVVANGRDIEEWETAMRRIQKNEALLKAIGHNFPLGSITVFNQDFGIEYIDGELISKHNHDPDTLVGQNLFEAFSAPYEDNASVEDVKKKIQNVFKGEKLEYERVYKNSIYHYTALPIKTGENLPPLAMVVCRDITQIRHAKQRLKDNQELINSINSNIIEGIYRSTPEGKIIYANEAFANIFGYNSPAEVENVSTYQLYSNPGVRDDILNQLSKDKKIRNKEVRLVRSDNTVFWALLNISRNTDSNGYVYYDGAINDITERKRLETKFYEEKNLSDTIINSLPGIFYLYDENFKFLRWNKNLEDLTGYSASEIPEMSPLDLIPEKHQERVVNTVKKIFREGTTEIIESYIQTRSGNLIPFNLSGMMFFRKNKPYLLGVGVDISEQKHAEEMLKESLREKDILLKEVHHRVKNNLAIIQSLLFLQGQNSEEPDVRNLFKESQARIKSIALVHEKLYQSDSLARINLQKYIQELVTEVKNTFINPEKDIKTFIDAEEIKLDINKAIPCGLLINEVLSNAFQHAFEELDKGVVEVDCSMYDDEVCVIIKDNGKGLSDNGKLKEDQNSLGLNLVKGLTDQLSGTIRFYSDKGTTVKLNFKP